MTDLPTGFDLAAFVRDTLAEDLGQAGDITSAAVIPADARFTGVMASRDAIVVAGLPIAEAFFRALDPEVRVERLAEDGQKVAAGSELLRLEGRARAMLTAERSALNTVQHLSGIATLTRCYVDRMLGTGATLLDTRKTIPGLRLLEKYATRMGGATNHRMGLWDGAMIKDNHVAVAGGVGEAVRRAKAAGIQRIIVEVDSIDQIEPALAAGATHLLLDNMDPPTLRGAVTLIGGRVPSEASGGVRLDTVNAIAATGVTFISVGRLTQSAPAADVGLDFKLGRVVAEARPRYSPADQQGDLSMQRPISIVWFERCYLGALAIGLINAALGWNANLQRMSENAATAPLGGGFLIGTLILSTAISLLLWYFTARRRSVVTKWILAIFYVIGLLGLLWSLRTGSFPVGLQGIVSVFTIILNGVAIWQLFRSDARAWFGEADTVDGALRNSATVRGSSVDDDIVA